MLKRIIGGCSKDRPPSLTSGIRFLLLVIVGLFLATPFLAAQSYPGIDGYDLLSPDDHGIAFDYNSSGRADHLLFYRPGTGIVYIVQNNGGVFGSVLQSSSGIGGYDILSLDDHIVGYDYDHSGKKDHLICYRPGTGIIWILAHLQNSGAFIPVWSSNGGIGGYDLLSTDDSILPFDYNSNGLTDHLVIYRPGTGIIQILEHTNGFDAVYKSTDGIGEYDLMSASDRIAAYDQLNTGKADHLLLYRPGWGTVYIVQNDHGVFSPTYQSASAGIGLYDVKSTADILLPFDYLGNGHLNYILCYRPGTGIAYIIRNDYVSVFANGRGIGAYDLLSTSDRIFPFNYNTSWLGHLVLYRPGTGVIFIEANNNGVFSPVYESAH